MTSPSRTLLVALAPWLRRAGRPVKAGGTAEEALKGLAGLTGNCVGCHAVYRLDKAP